MKTCIELTNLAFGIKVQQGRNLKFRVTYGKQVRDDLTYSEAAKEFGYCVFHALSCDGKVNNEGP